MSNHPPAAITKELDTTLLAGGAGVLLLGLGLGAVGLFTSWTLRLGQLVIPSIVWVIAGGLLALGGLWLALISLRQNHCAACRASLETALAFFPPESERDVVTSFEQLDVVRLQRLPMGSGMESHVPVTLEYCGRCKSVALVKVTSAAVPRSSLLDNHLLTGPRLGPIIAQMAERSAAHEARFQQA
jgi:hypothetical protein